MFSHVEDTKQLMDLENSTCKRLCCELWQDPVYETCGNHSKGFKGLCFPQVAIIYKELCNSPKEKKYFYCSGGLFNIYNTINYIA